jgi:5-aminolevulinate synthase
MSVLVPGAENVAKISEYLLKNYNIYAQHINYPTVKKGEERLRITTNPDHTDEMINNLAIGLSNGLKSLNINYSIDESHPNEQEYILQIQRKTMKEFLQA